MTATPSPPRLLVTRPAARQEPFAGRARALGIETIAFPCVEIRPEPGLALPTPAALAAFDAVLFTSRHAVEAVAARRPFPWPGIRALAIGAATAEALERAGQTLARGPEAGASSEALVDALGRRPPLGRLLIVKGRGGRDLLASSQRARGTRVETLASYRRARPAADESLRRRALVERAPDIVSVTSDEGLDNLVALAGDALDALRSRPLIVNSGRGAARAREHGFGAGAAVATPPGDAGQLAALADWLAGRSAGRADGGAAIAGGRLGDDVRGV